MDEFLDLLKLTPGVAKVEEFRIPTLNGTPTKTPPRIVPEDRSEVNSQIKEMLDLNVIKTSNNPKKASVAIGCGGGAVFIQEYDLVVRYRRGYENGEC